MIDTCTYIGLGAGCTAPSLPGRNYCAEHLYVVYKEGTARAKRKKELTIVDKVQLVEELMHEAIAELEAEGFDCYGDSELKSNRFETEEAGLG